MGLFQKLFRLQRIKKALNLILNNFNFKMQLCILYRQGVANAIYYTDWSFSPLTG